MKKVLSCIFILFMTMSVFAQFAKSTDFSNIEILKNKDWTEVINPNTNISNYVFPISESYKINIDGHIGELQIGFYKDTSDQVVKDWLSKDFYEKSYRDEIKRQLGLALMGDNKKEAIPLYENPLGNTINKDMDVDLVITTSIITKNDFPSFQRKYNHISFFSKYGVGIIVYALVSNDYGFFGFTDEKLEYYIENSEFFNLRDFPKVKFVEKSSFRKKVQKSMSDFTDFEFVEYNSDLPIEFADISVLKDTKVFNGKLSKLKTTKCFTADFDGDKEEIRYTFFKELKKNPSSIEELKKYCIAQIIGYEADGKKLKKFKDADVKKEFNADFGSTFSSKEPLSRYSNGYSFVSVSFFYKENVGLLMRTVLFNDFQKNLSNFYKNEIFHSVKFK